MTATELVYDKLRKIAEEYLGPAADRFLERQIQFHLGKSPDQVTTADIPRLSEWIKVSLALLTDDKALVEEFDRRCLALTAK